MMRYSKRFLLAGAFELEHQTFAQIARPDADGVKGLNHFQHLGKFLRCQTGGSGEFLNGRAEVAVVVNVADEQFGDPLLVLVQLGVAHLLDQMLGERSLHRDRVKHELTFFLVLGGGADGRVRL